MECTPIARKRAAYDLEMSEDLPVFRYHSDPVSTGSVVREDTTCDLCRLERGWRYAGPAYGRKRAPASICPWCVADGSAAEIFDLVFVDTHGSGGVAPGVVDELTKRTPGYTAWQQEEWCFHCSDACDYLGPVGSSELRDLPEAG